MDTGVIIEQLPINFVLGVATDLLFFWGAFRLFLCLLAAVPETNLGDYYHELTTLNISRAVFVWIMLRTRYEPEGELNGRNPIFTGPIPAGRILLYMFRKTKTA